MTPPRELFASPEANSLIFVFARIMAPASRSFLTRNASFGGNDPFSKKEPPVVGMSEVSKLSFNNTGIPWRGERGPWRLLSLSSARARSRALGFSARMAFSFGPALSNTRMRSKHCFTSCSEERSPLSKAILMSAILAVAISIGAPVTVTEKVTKIVTRNKERIRTR